MNGNNLADDLRGGLAGAAAILPAVLSSGVVLFAPLGGDWLATGVTAAFIAAVLPLLALALFGGSSFHLTCPKTAVAAILAGAAAGLYAGGKGLPAEMVATAIFAAVALSGIIEFLLGATGLGRFVKYVPQPVIAGFLNGLAILVVMSQLPPLLGFEHGLEDLAEGIGQIRPGALALGAFSLLSGVMYHFVPADQMQMTMFMKNLGLAGGFLLLAHTGAGACDSGGRQRPAGALVAARKTVGRGQMHHVPAIACGCGLHLSDAVNLLAGGFGSQGVSLQGCGFRLAARIFQFQRSQVPSLGQLRRIGEACKGVLGRFLGHGYCAFSHRFNGFRAHVGGGDQRLALAHEHPQAQVSAFGPLRMLQLAGPHFDAERAALGSHGIGGIRAGLAGGINQGVAKHFGGLGHGHLLFCSLQELSRQRPCRKGGL